MTFICIFPGILMGGFIKIIEFQELANWKVQFDSLFTSWYTPLHLCVLVHAEAISFMECLVYMHVGFFERLN